MERSASPFSSEGGAFHFKRGEPPTRFTIPQKASIGFFARSLALTGLLLIGSVSASAGDPAFSFGIAGGVHGGSMNHFKDTAEGVTDPIKPGLIGIH